MMMHYYYYYRHVVVAARLNTSYKNTKVLMLWSFLKLRGNFRAARLDHYKSSTNIKVCDILPLIVVDGRMKSTFKWMHVAIKTHSTPFKVTAALTPAYCRGGQMH